MHQEHHTRCKLAPFRALLHSGPQGAYMASSVFSRPFFFFYSLLWRAALPFLKKSRRLADGWPERLIPEDWLAPDFPSVSGEHTVDIWLQAASGGEARLAVSVCRSLSKDKPLRVLVATWTRQGRDVIEKAIPALKEQIKLASRNYAKRQLTWFRRNQEAHWIYLPKEPDFTSVLRDSTEFLREKGLG